MAGGMFSQFGMDFDPELEQRQAQQQQLGNSLSLTQNVSRNPGVQSAANLGAIVGSGIAGPPPLTKVQQQSMAIQQAAKTDYSAWEEANPNASSDEKSLKFADVFANAAIKNGRADIGATVLASTQAQRQQINQQATQLEKLGYDTKLSKLKLDAESSGTAQQVWKMGETDPNKGFVARIDPITKAAVTDDGHLYKTGEYTSERPLDPERSSAVRLAAAQAKAAAADDLLDPDTLHDAAVAVLADPARMRQYASYGAKGQAIRDQVNKESSKILRAAGMTQQEVLRLQAMSQGQIKSTKDLVGMQNAVSAYETVAKGNGDRFLELAAKVNTSGVPLINSAMRLGKAAAGSPDAAEMLQVLQNYQTEVARIIANPRLVGQLSDTARKEMADVIPANLTVAQATRIINRLNVEFDLRNKGIQDALSTAGAGISVVPNPGAAPAASTPGKVVNWADLK